MLFAKVAASKLGKLITIRPSSRKLIKVKQFLLFLSLFFLSFCFRLSCFLLLIFPSLPALLSFFLLSPSAFTREGRKGAIG